MKRQPKIREIRVQLLPKGVDIKEIGSVQVSQKKNVMIFEIFCCLNQWISTYRNRGNFFTDSDEATIRQEHLQFCIHLPKIKL